MSFLDDIKKQPQETRETMFYLAVFVSVLLVGMIWFHSFQKNLYVLINPEEDVEKMLAVENAPIPSLFGSIWQVAGDLKGAVSGLLSGEDEIGVNRSNLEKMKVESVKVYTLPLSEYK